MDEIQKLTVQSVVNITPQAPVVSVVDAPWVAVTSVNGMTGDVQVEAKMGVFEANHFYRENTPIAYENGIYIAKEDFTSGNSFNSSDWNQVEAGSIDWTNVENKPTFATVATSGDYEDLTNAPSLADVATSGSYDDLVDIPSLATVATTGNYSDLSNTPDENKVGNVNEGDVNRPIYLDGGVPKSVNISQSGERFSVVPSVDANGVMEVGSTIDFHDTDAGTENYSTRLVSSNGGLYKESVSLGSNLLTGRDSWTLIDRLVLSEDTAGQSPLEVSIPAGWQFDSSVEYKVVVNFELVPGGAVDYYPYLQAKSGSTWLTGMSQFGYMKMDNGTFTTHSEGGPGNSSVVGLELHCTGNNQSLYGEVVVAKAGENNYWNVSATGGGSANSVLPYVFQGGGRLDTSDTLSGFRMVDSHSMSWLAGSFIELFGRRVG